MKKENYYKFIWVLSALLLLGFAIRLGVDYYKIENKKDCLLKVFNENE